LEVLALIVIGERVITFDSPVRRVIDAVRAVLARGWASYHYHHTVEYGHGSRIETEVVHANSLIGSVIMVIQISGSTTQTLLRIQLQGKWYQFVLHVLGSCFYYSYIRDVQWDVRKTLTGVGNGQFDN
jgi:hypothetical protein